MHALSMLKINFNDLRTYCNIGLEIIETCSFFNSFGFLQDLRSS